ncbi:hypothetical protein [Cupriavidus pinatubonensis]|uniref:hypothetical protein n=1 Tax=Cupriavidus pinatubonensis TaxID=248026 RepID=UPI0011295EC3|nr:hypothetical protein [Cupriavidus pinatubonensis]TPQ35717.1 hypothetical protein C2U69_20485 [Cupriavidus pinatubonensis]
MTVPDRDHQALLLRQGAAWIERLADLERWLDQRAADELASLQSCPDARLADRVEALRQRMWDAMQRAAAVPSFTRTIHGQPIAPPAPPPRRLRGAARLLKRTPIANTAQLELLPKGRR